MKPRSRRKNIVLVACARKKEAFATRAERLYISPLFEKAAEYAHLVGTSWYILSARYGLVPPWAMIPPYEQTLNRATIEARERWAHRVWSQLRPLVRPGTLVTFLAGERYREFLEPWLRDEGIEVFVPLAGMGIGQQLQWLNQQLLIPFRKDDL